jgi:flagellar biosynthesis/type III secretory pathway chaperone
MTPPALRDHQSPLEAALVEVRATLIELLAAAAEQHAAVVEHDRDRLEGVTLRQENLSSRLERAERQRLVALDGASIDTAIAVLPSDQSHRAAALNTSIRRAVQELQARHARTTSLLERSAELAAETIQFLQRLVGVQPPAYGARGEATMRQSLLVDSRA